MSLLFHARGVVGCLTKWHALDMWRSEFKERGRLSTLTLWKTPISGQQFRLTKEFQATLRHTHKGLTRTKTWHFTFQWQTQSTQPSRIAVNMVMLKKYYAQMEFSARNLNEVLVCQSWKCKTIAGFNKAPILFIKPSNLVFLWVWSVRFQCLWLF